VTLRLYGVPTRAPATAKSRGRAGTVELSIRLTVDEREWLYQKALAEERSMSFLVRQLIKKARSET